MRNGKKKSCFIFSKFLIICILFSFLIECDTNINNTSQTSASQKNNPSLLMLKTQDTKIVNPYGNEIILRGVNIGGWLVIETWMCPSDSTDEYTIRNMLSTRFGDFEKEKLINTYQNSWIIESDLDNIKNMGMNVIRVPFFYLNFMDNNGVWKTDLNGNKDFSRLDWIVNKASERGLYTILDLHGAQGSQNGKDHSGQSGILELFNNSTYKNRTIDLWKNLASHFKGNPNVAGYDLLNEPTSTIDGFSTKDQFDFYDILYQEVRAIDPDHIIFIESCWDWKDIPIPGAYNWTNVVYEFHYYDRGHDDFTHQKNFMDSKVADYTSHSYYNVPVLIGEFNGFNNIDSWKYILNTYNNQKWSWTMWTYKTYYQGNWGIYNRNTGIRAYINSDTTTDISAKWQILTSDSPNTFLLDTITKAAKGEILE